MFRPIPFGNWLSAIRLGYELIRLRQFSRQVGFSNTYFFDTFAIIYVFIFLEFKLCCIIFEPPFAVAY